MRYWKLRGAIREKFGTQNAFAEALGVNKCALSRKLAGKREWRLDEVQAVCRLLEIPADCVGDYFFSD